MLPPCSGLSRRGLETPEIAFTGGVPADLDSPLRATACEIYGRGGRKEESLRRGRTKESY